MDPTRYTTKTRDHESMDLEVVRLLSRVRAFYEEGHAIMDSPFLPFHIRTCIAKHGVTECGKNINGSITGPKTRNSYNLE